jgi:hypothetical protein
MSDAKLFRCLDNAFAVVMVLDPRLGSHVLLSRLQFSATTRHCYFSPNRSEDFELLRTWFPVS